MFNFFQKGQESGDFNDNFSPFFTKLITAKYCDQEIIVEAIKQNKVRGGNLLNILEEMTGKILNPELIFLYKKYTLFELKIIYGVPSFYPDIDGFDPREIRNLIKDIIPLDFCQRYQIIPLKQENNQILIAMVNPANLEAQDDLNRFLRPRNMTFLRLVNLVNKILAKAVEEKATEILIEPQAEFLQVRFRKDGILAISFANLPKKLNLAIIERLKEMANLKMNTQELSKKLKFKRKFQGKDVNFYVYFFHSFYGEKAIIKIFRLNDNLLLDLLINQPQYLQKIQEMLEQKGLILVTGGGDSGKSSTLYAMLGEVNNPHINILTIEDRLEKIIDGANQLETYLENYVTFDYLLDAIGDLYFDVLFVDKIRHLKTAQTLFYHALKGSLVLSSLSAKNAISVIFYLYQLGLSYEFIGECVTGIIHQSLIRKLCPDCCISEQITPEERRKYFSIIEKNNDEYSQVKIINKIKKKSLDDIKQGYICSKCKGSGYHGRIAVYEILPLNSNLPVLIDRGNQEELKKGILSSYEYALNLVINGLTTLEEIERFLPRN